MEVLQQVRLLLRRNVALRIRQPVILALELLWPVVIFLVVMVARNAIPPVAQPTCHYKAWALPSAGVVPFVQSMICNIDDCQNEAEYEDIPSYNGSSVRELVANTAPLIMDRSITELVSALPKGMRLMRVAVDALSGPDLSVLLDDGFPIKNLIQDVNQTKDLLHQINVTEEETDLILESSIQLPQVLEITNINNFCDSSDSKQDSNDAFGKLRKHLCQLDNTSRKNFFRQLKNQLDIKNIVQTMGLAMSELGRLDVGEILGNIGGLLVNLQSSNVLQEDVLRLVTALLDEVHLDQIDTRVMGLLIDDLEPLYRESEWATLIRVLKDVKLPSKVVKTHPHQGERRYDIEELVYPSQNEKMALEVNEGEINQANQSSNDVLSQFLGLAETGFDILRFLPQQISSQTQTLSKYFTILIDIADTVVMETEKASKGSNSTKFINSMGDILGAVFLNIADETKTSNPIDAGRKFCDIREFLKLVNSSDWNNVQSLQRLTCKISKKIEKMRNSSEPADAETRQMSFGKLQRLLNAERYTDMLRNIFQWANETKESVMSVKNKDEFSKTFMIQESSIDDLIRSVDCGTQGVKGVFFKLELSTENADANVTPRSTSADDHLNNKEKLLLLNLDRGKDIARYIKSNVESNRFANKTDFPSVLEELLKLMNAAGTQSYFSSTSSEFMRFIPAVVYFSKNFNSSITLKEGFKSFVSDFVHDLEEKLWNSITPKMVEDFSQDASRHFCVETEALEAKQLHWKWMLCKESSSSFRIPLLKKNNWEKEDPALSTKLDFNSTTLDAQAVTRIFLQLSSKVGLTVRILSQFLKPIEGCESTCGSEDIFLRKMCFLGRLQNVKSEIEARKNQPKSLDGEMMVDEESDILKQLRPFVSIDDEVIENYDGFLSVVRSSAVNNYTDWKDIVQLGVSGLRFLNSLDGKEHKLRPVFHVLNSLISLLKNRVSDAALTRTSPMVQIENVFPDSPLTQDVVKSLLPLLPEVFSTFFWTALAPSKVLNLVASSGKNISTIMTRLCNSSLTDYLYNPSMTDDDFEELNQALCQHQFYDVFEEVFQDPDIQEIVFEASSTEDVAWEDMHENLLEIVSLLLDLVKLRKADISAFPPLTKWQKMAMETHGHAMSPSVMLFVLNNKLFSGFCNHGNGQTVYQELCAMSEPAFSKRLALEVNQGVQNALVGKVKDSVDPSVIFREVMGAIRRMPEVRSVVKEVFGFDLGGGDEVMYLSGSGFRNQILKATEKAFDIVDGITKGGLSTVVLESSLPEVFGDFASLIDQSDDGKLNHFMENRPSSNQADNSFFFTNLEVRRVESYMRVLGDYFYIPSNYRTLKNSFCQALRKNRTEELRIRHLKGVLCNIEPSKWVLHNMTSSSSKTIPVWLQIDEFFSDGIDGRFSSIMKNETKSLFIQERKNDILNSIEKFVRSGMRISNSSTIQASSIYFSILRSFAKKLEDVKQSPLLENMCLTNSDEKAIKESIHKLLSSVTGAEELTCGLLNRNISGFYSWISKTADLKNALKLVANGKKYKENCKKTWNWLSGLVDDLENVIKRLTENVSEKELELVGYCIKGFKESPLYTSFQLHINILKQAAKFVSTFNTSPGRWKELKNGIFERISQHLPAFFKISDVMSERSSIRLSHEHKDEFNKNLRESLINFNWLLQHSFSASALSKKVCTDDSADFMSVFRPPALATPKTRIKLIEFFCSENAVQHLLQHMNQSSIKSKVLKAQEKDFFSGNWLQELVSSSEVLVDIGVQLGSTLTEIRIQDFYDVLSLFSKHHVIQNVVDSFGKLKSVLDPVFPGSQLSETLKQIMKGLQAFNSLTKLADFDFKYSVKDVFGEKSSAVLEDLEMDPQTIEEFTNSEVNLKLANIDKDSGLVSFCDGDSVPSTYCILSSRTETSVSVDHLQDLVFQRFLRSFGSLGIEGVLREAELDPKEAENTLEVLSNAPGVAEHLKSLLQQVTTTVHPEVNQLFQKFDQGVDWLATPEALSIGGKVLCGKPLNSLSKKFMLLSPDDTENKIEPKELLRLPTEFCRHGYKEIMKMRGGAILWGFLKPLFRGKILFAPKSYPPALAIISKVNETFQILEEQIKFVKAAAEGTSGLHYLQRKNETLQSLQNFLSSKVVSKFLGSPSWSSALSWLESPSSYTRSLLHLVELVGNVTECISLDRFIGFDTEEELEAAAATLHDRREFIAAIVFMNDETENKRVEKRWTSKSFEHKLPKNIKYKIRMDIDNVPTTEYIKYRWWRPYPYDDFFEDLRYFRGFLQLQDTVDSAIISLHTDRQDVTSKYLQQFPYPCHQRDKFGTLLKGSMPAVMTISWVFIVAFLVRERVLGRELELDETLNVMGLKKSSGWLAWFVTGLSVLLVSVAGIVAVLKWGGITPNSDPVILFLFVADFALLLIAYCQLMSTFFNRASTAALLSVLFYVLSFFPFLLFVTWELDFLYWQKLLSCVLVSTSFCFGCLYLNRYEDQGQGVHWNNLWHSPVAEDKMNFGTTLVAMVLCSLFYFLLSWYSSRILTGWKGRKPLAWYFLFREPPPIDTDSLNGTMKSKTLSIGGMKDGVKRTVGISIQNVHAFYSRKGSKEWRALSGLNLDLFEDNITALLGHNGAGKTTTIKILTGRIQPTSGKVSLYDIPVAENLAEARKLIGFCPQNNTLYDKLTVKEHLNLFARLKGLLDNEGVEADVKDMLQRLNLEEKKDECTETLSGGQRRRLCVGIAFVGGSRVVILDEPTSSVDPVARRGIWDLILSYKKGRTILFTTHHLDEADILSDRVAILHKGHMLCSGSPLELKGRFGSGFRLSLLFPPGSEHGERDSGRASSIADYEEPAVSVKCDEVMDFIQSHVPDATLLENDDSQLVFSLPAEPLSAKPLSEFFAHLEKCLPLWGFHSCSLSSATLEEVFLTLCRLEDAKAAHNSDKFTDISPFRLKKYEATTVHHVEDPPMKKNTFVVEVNGKEPPPQASCLAFQQFKSLVKKRYWHTRRNWKALMSSIVMPCVFIALAMGLAVGRPQKSPDPSIELMPSLYASKDHKAVSFFEWKESSFDLGDTLLEVLKANTTPSQSCVPNHQSCQQPLYLTESSSERCLCEKECSPVMKGPASYLQSPDQILYNMSDTNIPRYLLDSYLLFNEKRYGGWTIKKETPEDTKAKVWFENSGYHSAPAYLNTLNNALLKSQTGRDYGIRTWSHPLRLSVEQLGRETLLQRLGEVGIAFVFLIGLSLVPCTFAVYLVGERESAQKRLQLTSLPAPLYWLAALLCDLAVSLAACIGCAAIVGAFALPAFYQRHNFRAVCALIFLYGWATTPLTYLCSGFFREGSLAFMVIFTSHLFVGLVIMLSLVSLRMISISKDVASTLDLLQRFSLLFPQYSLVGGLTDLNENQIRSEIFAQFGQDVYTSPFLWSSLGPNFVALFAQGVVFFLLTVLIEMLPIGHWWGRLRLKGRKPRVIAKALPDDGLKPLLQIQNISQIYHTKAGNKHAVDNFSLSIPEGECFGLVGANGAGKTTLFRLLIGEIPPTAGKIISVGLQSKLMKKHQFLGYCPQKDALDDLLTPRQHLEVYAGIRGIASNNISKVVEHSLKSLELEMYADRQVHTLSGGTKRKLCTAIAMLGDPELILLDEPTSGMDPATRRLVWKCISKATEDGRSVILTSHSIEDCDMLCSRLGIMVNGRLACLDNPVRLKSRLGTGYTLSFRVPENQEIFSSLLKFIQKEIPSAVLQVHSGRRVELSLPDESMLLSSLFCHLEECARQFGIEDLAIDPTTLDQVFVNFVRQQSDAVQEGILETTQTSLTVPITDHVEMCCTKL